VNVIITLQNLGVEGRIIQIPGTFCGHFKIENREVTGTVSRYSCVVLGIFLGALTCRERSLLPLSCPSFYPYVLP